MFRLNHQTGLKRKLLKENILPEKKQKVVELPPLESNSSQSEFFENYENESSLPPNNHPLYPFFNNTYIQSIIENTEKDTTVCMARTKINNTLFEKKKAALINQLLEVCKKSEEDAGGAFTYDMRESGFFCYAPGNSLHSPMVCLDSHHIHMYINNDLKIQVHAKFLENRKIEYINFNFKDFLNFNVKTTHYQANNSQRLVTLPEDLGQILLWLKDYFNSAMREDNTYFQEC